MPKSIPVSIFGASGTGKKTLRSALDGKTYIRPADHASFVFDAQLAITPPSDSGFEPCVTIVTTRADNWTFEFKEMFQRACDCGCVVLVVVTMSDLIPRDTWTPERLHYFVIKPHLAWAYDVECKYTSLINGDGVDDVMDFLAESCKPVKEALDYTVWTHGLLDRVYSRLLDCVAAVFALPTQKADLKVEEQNVEINTFEELYKLYDAPFALDWAKNLSHRIGMPNLPIRDYPHRISNSLLAKESHSSEMDAMEHASRLTSVPIPRIHFRRGVWMLMDYIEGEMLLECWDRLTRFMRFRIACTLRLYVKQLRSLEHENVGGVKTGKIRGPIFLDDVFGPYNSLSHFREFCTYVAMCGWEDAMTFNPNLRLPFPDPDAVDWTPVFVHGDLNMSNILLDKNNTLWLIDWSFSGYAPSSFESFSMRHINLTVHKDATPASWESYREFIAGPLSEDAVHFFTCLRTGIRHFDHLASLEE